VEGEGAGVAIVAGGGSVVGVLPHETSMAAMAKGRNRQATCRVMVGDIAEGVLFTNGGLGLPARMP